MTPCGSQLTSQRSRSQSTSSWQQWPAPVTGTRAPPRTPRPRPLGNWTRSQSPGWLISVVTRWSLATGAPLDRARGCSIWATPAILTPPFRWEDTVVWWIFNHYPSILQALFHTPALVNYLKYGGHTEACTMNGFSSCTICIMRTTLRGENNYIYLLSAVWSAFLTSAL